jgi:hypothetical protein
MCRPGRVWGFLTRPPGRVAADARDTDLGGESEMFRQLIAVHQQVRLKPDTR